jgi:hypothetical protein
MAITIALAILALVALAAAIFNLHNDGYHRIPTAPIARQDGPRLWR